MSTHIAAPEGAVAETVLMPGDPLRAKWIAEIFLDGAECFNQVRGMFGFTGRYKGMRVSVQGSGMGVPSMSIYAHELVAFHGARTLIRVGSCGAMQPQVKVRDLVLAMTASTDSQINRLTFGGFDFAPCADWTLLRRAADIAEQRGVATHVGPIFTSDRFYADRSDYYDKVKAHGALAVEMEAAALYTIAARFGVRALAVLTVSDHLLTQEALPAEERERSFADMTTLALETALADGTSLKG